MTRYSLVNTLAVGVALVIGMSTLASGQPDPAGAPTRDGARQGGREQMGDGARPGGQQMRLGQPPPAACVLEVIGDNLFILNGQTLTKYNVAAFTKLGTAKLGEGAAAVVAEDGARRPPMGPPPGALLLPASAEKTADLLVVTGDTFYRVLATDLTVAVTMALPKPTAPADAQRGAAQRGRNEQAVADNMGDQGGPGGLPGRPGPGGAITAKLAGKTLFLVRGLQVLAIDTVTGKVIGQDMLQAPTMATPAR